MNWIKQLVQLCRPARSPIRQCAGARGQPHAIPPRQSLPRRTRTCRVPQASQAPTFLKGGRSMIVRPNRFDRRRATAGDRNDEQKMVKRKLSHRRTTLTQSLGKPTRLRRRGRAGERGCPGTGRLRVSPDLRTALARRQSGLGDHATSGYCGIPRRAAKAGQAVAERRSVFCIRAIAMTDFYIQIIVSAMASPTGSLFPAIVRCSLRLR
jgi:hypothetical protein